MHEESKGDPRRLHCYWSGEEYYAACSPGFAGTLPDADELVS